MMKQRIQAEVEAEGATAKETVKVRNDRMVKVMVELLDGVLRQIEQIVAKPVLGQLVLPVVVEVVVEMVQWALQALCTGRTKGMSF